MQDISQYCAAALVDESVNPGFREAALFGPRLYSSLDIKHAVEEVTGKQATMKVIKKENLVSWFEGQVPKFYAQEFADMVISILPGGTLEEDFVYGENTVRGKVDIVDALRCVA